LRFADVRDELILGIRRSTKTTILLSGKLCWK